MLRTGNTTWEIAGAQQIFVEQIILLNLHNHTCLQMSVLRSEKTEYLACGQTVKRMADFFFSQSRTLSSAI